MILTINVSSNYGQSSVGDRVYWIQVYPRFSRKILLNHTFIRFFIVVEDIPFIFTSLVIYVAYPPFLWSYTNSSTSLFLFPFHFFGWKPTVFFEYTMSEIFHYNCGLKLPTIPLYPAPLILLCDVQEIGGEMVLTVETSVITTSRNRSRKGGPERYRSPWYLT